MDGARVKHFGSNGSLRLDSSAVGGDLRNNELAPCLDDYNGNDQDFADMLVDSLIDVRARLCRDFEAICNLWRSDNGAVLENARKDFSPAWRAEELSRSAAMR